MNRRDFGRLIMALRKEHIVDGKSWSQGQLAAAANTVLGRQGAFNEDIIGNIERGKRVLDPPELLAIATALELTSGERQEFFLAASGIDSQDIIRKESSPRKVLSCLLDTAGRIHLPAFVIDSYCDIVAFNAAVPVLLELEETPELDPCRAYSAPLGLNMMRFVFSTPGVNHFKDRMREKWEDYAYKNIMIFRTLTLQNRLTPYFQSLLFALKRYAHFRFFWEGIFCQEKDYFVDNKLFHLRTKTWGKLVYSSTDITALTTAGNLFLCIYAPASDETARVFREVLSQTGPAMIRIDNDWPAKSIP